MLIVKIKNDGTGTEEVGNYDYSVNINYETVGSGRIEGYERGYGWKVLIIKLAEQLAREMVEEAQDGKQ